MNTESLILEMAKVLAWPTVVLITLLVFGGRLIELIAHFRRVEISSKWVQITLERLAREYGASAVQIEKLHGLSGHDLWALDAFLKQPNDSFKYVKNFTAQRRAIVHSFIEMGLLEIVGQGDGRYIQPKNWRTPLSRQQIDFSPSKFYDAT